MLEWVVGSAFCGVFVLMYVVWVVSVWGAGGRFVFVFRLGVVWVWGVFVGWWVLCGGRRCCGGGVGVCCEDVCGV